MKRFSVFLAALAVLVAVGCDPPPPDLVWVPGPDFEAALIVGFGEQSRAVNHAGDWIVLHAERSMGPWVRVEYRDLPANASWLRQPPAVHEVDVEANVRWIVEPSGPCRFNIPTAQDIKRRMIRCDEPGTFELWAESSLPDGGRVTSNMLKLVIRD